MPRKPDSNTEAKIQFTAYLPKRLTREFLMALVEHDAKRTEVLEQLISRWTAEMQSKEAIENRPKAKAVEVA